MSKAAKLRILIPAPRWVPMPDFQPPLPRGTKPLNTGPNRVQFRASGVAGGGAGTPPPPPPPPLALAGATLTAARATAHSTVEAIMPAKRFIRVSPGATD